jgi:hypothetical protein
VSASPSRSASWGELIVNPYSKGPTFPLGLPDLGYVDPFEVVKARTANQIPEPDALIYLTRTATDDEILAAYEVSCYSPGHWRGITLGP